MMLEGATVPVDFSFLLFYGGLFEMVKEPLDPRPSTHIRKARRILEASKQSHPEAMLQEGGRETETGAIILLRQIPHRAHEEGSVSTSRSD